MGRKAYVILLVVVAILMLFSNREAKAVANGDGTCDAAESVRYDCGIFGGGGSRYQGVIEFLGTEAVPVPPAVGEPGTKYKYLYTGDPTTHINVGWTLDIARVFDTKEEINCSQWIVGTGDTVTGYGALMPTLGTCRTAPNQAEAPNLVMYTDPSLFQPVSFVVRFDKNNQFAAIINGPGVGQAAVSEAGATLTAGNASVTYSNQGGTVTITQGTGRIIPFSEMKLCLLNVGGDPAAFPDDYTCEFIEYITEQCDIKTTGYDPCRSIGGGCLSWP